MSGEAERARQSSVVGAAGRLGHAARGALYATVGLFAIQIPLGLGGRTTDQRGALALLAEQPLGSALLLALAVGLVGYSVWRLVQALVARPSEGQSRPGLGKRAVALGMAVFYGAAAAAAFHVLLGARGGTNEPRETATVLSWPHGRYLVGAIALGFLGVAAFDAYRAVTGHFRRYVEERELPAEARRPVFLAGVIGHAARGAVFGLIGIFLARAAVQYDAREAVGLDGALLKLAEAQGGELLLAMIALGLLAYSAFCFVLARYGDV